MSKKFDFQYVVIGSGPAGATVATTLAKAKKSVALVEGRFFGGSNLNTRDVPYAVALNFAHTYAKINSAPEFANQDFSVNLPSVISRELKAVINAGGNNKKLYEDFSVVCLNGYANFLDAHTIAIKDKKITSANFILATGAHLNTGNIAGTDTTSFLTPETAIKVRRLPKVIAVIGAGSAGCEIASFYAELGSKVILFESANRILPREDTEVSTVTADYFAKQLGVNVLSNCKAVAIGQDATSKYIVFRYGGTEKMVRIEEIALATGSLPNTDYGLENAGVKYKETGILVNKLFETTAKHIHAIGDCIGGESSTERAYQQGLTLATNIIKKAKNPINYCGITRFISTPLQIATVDLNEQDLLKQGRKYRKAILSLSDITAGQVDDLKYGFVKLLTNKNNYIIGATIVAPHAGLLAEEIAIATRHHHTAVELASTPHLINSYNQAIKLAARQIISKKK